MEERLVKPTIDRLWSIMKPGGFLLAFFHTREAGPDSTCYRYHVNGTDILEMQEVKFALPGRPASEKQSPRLQRVFNNRHIENLFRDFAVDQIFSGARCHSGSAGGALATRSVTRPARLPCIAD